LRFVSQLIFLIVISKKEMWLATKKNLKIKEDAKIFAPGNLRAIKSNKGYKECIEKFMDEQYQLRY
jgi:fructose-1,6-bisphosphatase